MNRRATIVLLVAASALGLVFWAWRQSEMGTLLGLYFALPAVVAAGDATARRARRLALAAAARPRVAAGRAVPPVVLSKAHAPESAPWWNSTTPTTPVTALDRSESHPAAPRPETP